MDAFVGLTEVVLRRCKGSGVSSLDNDVSDSPLRSAGQSPEHNLQSTVLVKEAQLNACEGKASERPAWPIDLFKPNHSRSGHLMVSSPDTRSIGA